MKSSNTTSVMTILSTVLVLILLGMYGITTFHTSKLSDILRQNIKIVVQLQDSLTENQIQNIQNEINQLKETSNGSIEFIPKSDAMDIMELELGTINAEMDENPFNDMMTVKLEKEFIDREQLESVSQTITEMDGVVEANFFGTMYDFIGKNIRNLSLLLLFVGLILTVFAFSLMYSTIYLSMYSDRFKIRTMELVGASWRQVRRPFVEKALRIAFVSSIISIVVLSIATAILYWRVELIQEIINFWYVGLMFFILIIFCLLITQIATFFVLKRYLGSNESNLYT